LNDRRPDVRQAAFDAFISRAAMPRSAMPAVIAAWRDPEPRIRSTAERVLREFTVAEGLTPAELEPLAALLSNDRDDVVAFLAWAAVQHVTTRDWCLEHVDPKSKLFATLSSQFSLACAQCGPLGTGDSWSHETSEPKALKSLERVVTLETGDWDSSALLRCKACLAHFTLFERTEIDVNSRHDWSSLVRLKLSQLRQRYAAHVDWKHPRFEQWQQAAEADLRSVDPAVRELAKWELSADPQPVG
jgi:hypothetical protein